MDIIHQFAGHKARKESRSSPYGLLTNRAGSFFLWEEDPTTRYSGYFLRDASSQKTFKIIEHIRIKDEAKTTQFVNNIHTLRKHSKSNSQAAFLPSSSSALLYSLDAPSSIELTLDIREIFDSREWGRHYSCWEEQGCVIVEFVKRTDSREDSTHDQEEYRLYLAVFGHERFEKAMEWELRDYGADRARNSPPFIRYVMRPGLLFGKKLCFSANKSKDNAILEAKRMLRQHGTHVKNEEKSILALLRQKKVKGAMGSNSLSEEAKIAFLLSLESLDRLLVHGKDSSFLMAGLPWFFTAWPRDSLICIKTLSLLHPKASRKILMDYALALGPDGRVANVKGSALGSADSAGWLFARVDELQNETRMDPKALRNPSTLAAEGLLGSLSTDGFLENKSLETWMDTSYEDDGRFGKRIEIQALSLRLLRAASRFTKNGKYELREKSYLERVKKSFFNGKSLADGLNDPTIRPNLFIAAYLYPDLLSPKEWEACFDFALPKLWLSWGGLSTINTKHPLFQKEHTGEDNRSYHRGDSWYYLNCMAAISLLRVNPKKYRKYADKILCASVQEILWQGAIGHHAELSSASSLKSQGCLSQAWSAAMFAELVLEISGK